MGAMVSVCGNCFGGEPTTESYSSFRRSSGQGQGPVVTQPDPEERRRQLAEAAEKRLQAQENRGIKDPESVRRQQKRKEEMERKEEELARMGNSNDPGLRWQVS